MDYAEYYQKLSVKERLQVRDIYELIRQRESEIERFQKEIERAQKEMEALRLAAKLLDDGSEPMPRAVTPPASTIAPETPVYNAAPATRLATTPAATPTPWASAKQFP